MANAIAALEEVGVLSPLSDSQRNRAWEAVGSTLPRRPRGRRLARVLGKSAAAPQTVDPTDREILDLPARSGPISARLHARLTPADLDATRSGLTPEEAAALAEAPPR